MIPKIGEKLRSKLTGRLYEVKLLIGRFAILEGENGINRVYTEQGNLKVHYERVGDRSHGEDLPTPDDPIA